MSENPYEPPTPQEPEPDTAKSIVGRTFLGKLATPVLTLLCLDYAWIAYDQFRAQKYPRVLHAIALIILLGSLAWRCRVAYHRRRGG